MYSKYFSHALFSTKVEYSDGKYVLCKEGKFKRHAFLQWIRVCPKSYDFRIYSDSIKKNSNEVAYEKAMELTISINCRLSYCNFFGNQC